MQKIRPKAESLKPKAFLKANVKWLQLNDFDGQIKYRERVLLVIPNH